MYFFYTYYIEWKRERENKTMTKQEINDFDDFVDLDEYLNSEEFKNEMKKYSFEEDNEEIEAINDKYSILHEMTAYERFVL